MKPHKIETDSETTGRMDSLIRIKRSLIRRSLTGVVLATGLATVAWSTGYIPSAATLSTAFAATKPKPAVKSSESESETAESKIKLFYISASWARVFQDIAATGDLEVIADKLPRGRYSRTDRTDYSRKDALRIVNKELEIQGLRLIEKKDFLILVEVTTSRAQYPPAVLPKTTPVKSESETDEQEIVAKPAGFRADSMTQPRDNQARINANQEIIDQKSKRYTSRSPSNELVTETEQPAAVRRSPSNRHVRQTSHEEFPDAREAAPARKVHPFDARPPSKLEAVGAPAPATVFRAKHVPALELAKRVYRSMRSSAELIESGRNELPAFRVSARSSNVADANSTSGKHQGADSARSLKSEPPLAEATASSPVEFMISIDEAQDELLIDGAATSVNAVIKLLNALDRPEDGKTSARAKSSTKYVCQIAEQLPAEIDRIREGRGSKPKGRVNRDDDVDEPLPNERSERKEISIGGALGNLKGEVNIQVIEDLDVMVIIGNEKDVEQVEKVIKDIEKLAVATAPRVELVHLKNVDSESLAELLTSVFEKLTKFPGKATQPRESVAIIPVTKPNSLLIIAPGADMENILELADELDQPVDPETEFQVFALKSAIATEVQTLITEFYKDRKSLGAKSLVVADPRSNSVIVRARPRDLTEIASLIKRLDREGSESINVVRIFVLKNSVASELAAVINAAIQSVLSPPTSSGSGGGGGGQGGNQGLGGGQVEETFKSVKSTVLSFLSINKGESRQLQSGILSDIRVTPDSHANSLIVTASEKSMELIAALIQQLDRPTSTVSEIKVFWLEHADASQMVNQLNSLFNNQTQGQGGNNAGRQQLGVAIANADDASSSLVPLKFSVDTRTNSVIAVGSGDALRVVEAIMLRLDQSDLRSRKNVVVRLNNSPATQIAQSITTFFTQQRDLTQNDPNLISNVEQLEREVIVIPDTISNNLLVSSTPRYFPDILAMITKLDAVPKQVVIQALIVEVQLNNTDEFGIELGLQSPVLFKRSLIPAPVFITQTNTSPNGVATSTQSILSAQGSPGFDFTNPSLPVGNNLSTGGIGGLPVGANPNIVGGQGLSNYSLGRTNSDVGFGGLVLSAGSDAVNVLLRALAANRKIQILSRPQIRALDSQLASVFVGQNIPTVSAFVTNQQTGVISPTLTPVQTGIGMEVTPRINQDGNVVIQMYAYRSQLSKETVIVTTDSRGQPVGQRITDLSNVRTTVLVPSNSTIVIGGMISSRDDSFTRKAPFLGDLPVVGSLFRYDNRSTVRSELLIFLTPRIISGACEEESLKEIEMGRIHFIESEAEEVHGPLRALPSPDDVFEGEDSGWVSPSPTGAIPVSPAPLRQLPTPLELPTNLPPPPSQASPNIPPPPPPADPNVTQIKASRLKATEDDEAEAKSVTTANWIEPSTAKKRSAPSRKLLNRSK